MRSNLQLLRDSCSRFALPAATACCSQLRSSKFQHGRCSLRSRRLRTLLRRSSPERFREDSRSAGAIHSRSEQIFAPARFQCAIRAASSPAAPFSAPIEQISARSMLFTKSPTSNFAPPELPGAFRGDPWLRLSKPQPERTGFQLGAIATPDSRSRQRGAVLSVPIEQISALAVVQSSPSKAARCTCIATGTRLDKGSAALNAALSRFG